MLIKRYNIKEIYNTIERIADKHFNIQTQYKFLKIKKVLKEEVDIYNQQLISLQSYCETNPDGTYITTADGGIKIKEEFKEKSIELVNAINSLDITVPDIYFSIDEFENLGFTLHELELLEPFIKD